MANNTYQSIRHFGLRTSFLAVVSSLVLVGAPQVAQAAGLGRLVVLSALGQPLRAEIEITATRQELVDMKAQLASPETFKQAGLDYASGLMSVRFSLDKRPNGQAIIKLTSERPMNDPFIDMLLELNWSSGKLVREYTFLLNPQEYVAKTPGPTTTTPALVSAPTVDRPAPPVVVNIRSGSPNIDNDVRARAVAQVQGGQVQGVQQQAPQRSVDSVAPQSGEGYEVKRGETLQRIATATKLEGVSLDQMLVGLFRANPGAFDGANMNRLRTGAILSKPAKSAVESISQVEARKIIVAQSSDWNAYQSRLAGAAVKSQAADNAAGQGSSGKITAKVDDRAERASPRDQVRVSRADSASRRGSGAGSATAKVSDEDLIAKDRALKEAQERVAVLEKNNADLLKLIELKNQNLADLQKQLTASPAPAPTPVSKPGSTTPAKVADPVPTPAPTPAPMPEPVQNKVEPPAPPPPPPPPPVQPIKRPPPPPPPPPEEPGFFEDLLDPIVLAAVGGGILAIIAGFLFWRRRRALAEAAEEQSLNSTITSSGTTTGLMDSSVFRNTGGQNVDTSKVPPQTDFSQAGPGSIDTDEVDPVAEADVYMAYGRDAQAEEILLEARQKDPKRVAIAVKLLEIYSGRKDAKQFELLATDLYGETNGVGADWEKVAAMGRSLDPNNPIFRGIGSIAALAAAKAVSASPAAPAVATRAVAPATLIPPDFTESVPMPAPVPSGRGALQPETSGSNRGGGNVPPIASRPAPAVSPPEKPRPAASGATGAKAVEEDLDFDIGTRIAPLAEVLDQQEAKLQQSDLDFDLGGDTLLPPDSVVPADFDETVSNEQTLEDDAVEFDVNLTESTFLGRVPPSEPSSFDMASIDLDLHSPELDIAEFEDQPSSADAAKAPRERDEDHGTQGTQVSTAVNPDFAREQMETVVTPPSSDFSTLQDDDLASELIKTQTMPEAPASQSMSTVFNFELANQQAETIIDGQSTTDMDPDVGSGEEVATKLDLAKAYEEMGDVEGARELLQEVLKEGNVGQREAAQDLLARIGG